MKLPGGDRLTEVGSAILGTGVAIAVGYWLVLFQGGNTKSFWSLPAFAGIAIGVIGLMTLFVGLFAPSGEVSKQVLRSGRNSKNYQAGRDIRVDSDEDPDNG